MKRVRISFETEVPDDTSYEDIAEWVNFELGFHCQMKCSNPLQKDLEAIDQPSIDVE